MYTKMANFARNIIFIANVEVTHRFSTICSFSRRCSPVLSWACLFFLLMLFCHQAKNNPKDTPAQQNSTRQARPRWPLSWPVLGREEHRQRVACEPTLHHLDPPCPKFARQTRSKVAQVRYVIQHDATLDDRTCIVVNGASPLMRANTSVPKNKSRSPEQNMVRLCFFHSNRFFFCACPLLKTSTVDLCGGCPCSQ